MTQLDDVRNAAWMVRHYPRPHQRQQRKQAINALGVAIRKALETSPDAEPVLVAIIEGLLPHEERRPF